tara:strand:+ start:21701 stop:22798 length:1098 start_codon:yes stop_codon:yes gene_type:complete
MKFSNMTSYIKNKKQGARLGWVALSATLMIHGNLWAAGEDHGHSGHGGDGENATHDDHSGHSHDEHDSHDHGSSDEHEDHSSHGHSREEGHRDGVVELSPEIVREFGIEVSEVTSGTLQRAVRLPGEIDFNRERMAYVTPRFAGTVTEIKLRLGDAVKKGDVMALLESSDTLVAFTLTAPIDGVVVRYDITPGETVEAGARLFTVADLSTVWADLRVYQQDMNEIQKGSLATVRCRHDEDAYEGKVVYVSPSIDKHTRTGLARVEVDNRSGKWKPGEFIQGRVLVEESQVRLSVPRSAVLVVEDRPSVFVQTAEGFEVRPLELGRSDGEQWEVISGLEPKERIVVRNPISLKAEMSKDSFVGHQH